MSVSASTISVLPSGGIGLSLETNATALENIAGSDTKNVRTSTVIAAAKEAAAQTEKAVAVVEAEPTEEDLFRNLVIAQVHNYVNVRSIPSEDGEIVGKLYDASVGNLLEEDNGWYKIESGSVTGYVKGEFCVTGEDAVELAKKVGTRLATVTTTTLKVRTQPGLDASVMGLVPIEDELVVSDEVDGWVQVDVEEGIGWVSTDYVTLHTEFVKAESKAEEEARLKKEAEEREKARRAAAAKSTKNSSTASQSASVFTAAVPSDGTMGAEVVNYALQFVGNPYVYGGSSLTQGTDCSGFVMSVYANFGVSLPHSSAADRSQGYAVDGGLENAQPGDIVCYSGHVAIYAGNGQIVHASTSKTGIIVSNADYKTPLAVRRIF
ncbi:MAG: C40 family peptidase [Lachnospiraceae bacterium]|nr:C40 family peptidase [Lachnospiraceae bacterium]MBR1854235.1 C40 family peptidase [Lachnospiraceae bacterium]